MPSQPACFHRLEEILALVWGIEAGYLGRTGRQMATHDGIAAEKHRRSRQRSRPNGRPLIAGAHFSGSM